MRKLLAMPIAAQILTAAGVASLAFALTMQYGLGVAPCELCTWQRIPFAFVIGFGSAAVLMRPFGKHTQALLGVIATLLLANAGIALFHSGVERHWWEFHSSCTGSPLEHVKSVEDMRRALLEKPVVRCDQISWSVFGLSMANLNIVYSAALAAFAALAASRVKI